MEQCVVCTLYTSRKVRKIPSHSLIRIFTGLILESKGYNSPSCGRRWLWSDCSDAHVDLCLLLAHMSERCVFSRCGSYGPVIHVWACAREKPTVRLVRPAKTQISLRIRAVWTVFANRMCLLQSPGYPKRAKLKSCRFGRVYRLISTSPLSLLTA